MEVDWAWFSGFYSRLIGVKMRFLPLTVALPFAAATPASSVFYCCVTNLLSALFSVAKLLDVKSALFRSSFYFLSTEVLYEVKFFRSLLFVFSKVAICWRPPLNYCLRNFATLSFSGLMIVVGCLMRSFRNEAVYEKFVFIKLLVSLLLDYKSSLAVPL